MFTMSFERLRRVLCLKFTGLLANEDLDAIDPASVCVAGAQSKHRSGSSMPLQQRASKPSSAAWCGLVVAPPWAGQGYGESYRWAHNVRSHAQPIIVATLADAYALLDIVIPCFEPLPTPDR